MSILARQFSYLSKRLNISNNVFLQIPNIGTIRFVGFWRRPQVLTFNKMKKLEKIKGLDKPPAPRYEHIEWNFDCELFALQARINESIDNILLRQALTDKSYVIKEKREKERIGIDIEGLNIKDNEALSYEGINIMRKAIHETLSEEYPKLPPYGIEKVCDYLLSENTQFYIASHLGLKDLILCEGYPPSEATFAKAFQAMVAALEKTCGEKRTKKFVQDIVITQLCGKNLLELWNISKPWLLLNEILGEKGLSSPEPRLIRQTGKNTILSVFIIGLYTEDKKLLGTGIGETLEIAQEMAARDSLQNLFEIKDPLPPFKYLSTSSN